MYVLLVNMIVYAVVSEDGFGKESYYQCFVAETDLLEEKVVQTGQQARACKIALYCYNYVIQNWHNYL